MKINRYIPSEHFAYDSSHDFNLMLKLLRISVFLAKVKYVKPVDSTNVSNVTNVGDANAFYIEEQLHQRAVSVVCFEEGIRRCFDVVRGLIR